MFLRIRSTTPGVRIRCEMNYALRLQRFEEIAQARQVAQITILPGESRHFVSLLREPLSEVRAGKSSSTG